MAGHDKTEIRTQLHAYLVKNHVSVPAYIRNKVTSSSIKELSVSLQEMHRREHSIIELVYLEDTTISKIGNKTFGRHCYDGLAAFLSNFFHRHHRLDTW